MQALIQGVLFLFNKGTTNNANMQIFRKKIN